MEPRRADIHPAPTWRMRSYFEMANWSDPWTNGAATASVGPRTASYDTGLRSYMLSVYNYMTSGVLLTGIVALLFANSGYVRLLFSPNGHTSPLGWLVMLAPLAVVMVLSFGINRLSDVAAQALFWAYAALMGLSLSVWLLIYTGGSVANAFFATAAGFAGLSLWGYTTKKDLAGFGSFLIMGLVGILVAMLLNVFLQSTGLDLVISIVGVLLFAGLTAYDTQRIKSMYFAVGGTAYARKSVVIGALQLYLDFINMFLFLLRLFGDRR
jgi:FtsH-binding integral membrane protein